MPHLKKILSLAFFTLPFLTLAQKPASYNVLLPVDIPVALSGNFGELRANHFHSGIDFKTQQVIGKNIRAIEEGYVSRAAVRPSGYGMCLYVTHPNGLTSVYAHLSAFSPRIDSVVRAKQHEMKSNNFDFAEFDSLEMPVARGEIIALSGNSGSSGGPHLHFEIRNTVTENALDPLQFYPQIIDKARPRITAIGVYAMDDNSFVAQKRGKQFYTATAKGTSGEYVLAKPIEVWGNIGFSIQGNDLMTGQSNVYGFYHVKLSCNKQVLYERVMDEVSFATTNDLNSLIDYEERAKSKRYFEKAFVDKNNDLHIYTKLHNSGIYAATKADTAQCEFVVSDYHNNAASLQFTLLQKPLADSVLRKLPKLPETGEWFDCKEEFAYSLNDFTFTASDKTFFTDFTFSAKEVTTPAKRTYYSKRYNIQTNQPIFKKPAQISVQTNLPDSLRSKALFERGGAAVFTKINDEGIATASVKFGGTYGIVVDTTAPKITLNLAQGANLQQSKFISFKISDDFSGIGSYNAYINDKWTLLDYDAKTATVYLYFKYADLQPDTMHDLRIEVSDVSGNKAVKVARFYR
ncbi:MAG: M23 family metallopeptidase [Bacteroidetes bacterium]|nr:M23 family metallopeptidase [Bacteroidota bacterium]